MHIQANATVATIVSDVEDRPPFKISLDALGEACKAFIPPAKDGGEQDPSRWLGWRLKKLQIPREREGHSNKRYAIVAVRTLSKKARRYAPSLLLDNGNNGNNGSNQKET